MSTYKQAEVGEMRGPWRGSPGSPWPWQYAVYGPDGWIYSHGKTQAKAREGADADQKRIFGRTGEGEEERKMKGTPPFEKYRPLIGEDVYSYRQRYVRHGNDMEPHDIRLDKIARISPGGNALDIQGSRWWSPMRELSRMTEDAEAAYMAAHKGEN